jgi:CRISPR-associated protein Cas5d
MLNDFILRIRGSRALFSEPHLRAEPHTYPVMTQSSANGILRSIYWKPQFEWEISSIAVHAPIRYVTTRASALKTNLEGDRTLMTSTALVDVDYVVHAKIVKNPHREKSLEKSVAEAHRRLGKKEFFRWPFFGQSECPISSYELLDGPAPEPLDINYNIGRMLFDLVPVDLGNGDGNRVDKLMPVFFTAKIEHGVVHCPQAIYDKYRAQRMVVRHRAHPNNPHEVSNAHR